MRRWLFDILRNKTEIYCYCNTVELMRAYYSCCRNDGPLEYNEIILFLIGKKDSLKGKEIINILVI